LEQNVTSSWVIAEALRASRYRGNGKTPTHHCFHGSALGFPVQK